MNGSSDPAAAAAEMVRTQLHARGIHHPDVLSAMEHVPRHRFVPHVSVEEAYADRALPTGEGQTISQPYIVAKMTEMLEPTPTMRVLEVGTGSGYQTAVLAMLVRAVVTIERHRALSDHARGVLESLDLAGRVRFIVGDGTLGHAAGAPYEGILVTAAAPAVPEALSDQLAEGGRLVLPLGDREGQRLCVIQRRGERFEQSDETPCRFVPLIGEQGWQQEQQP